MYYPLYKEIDVKYSVMKTCLYRFVIIDRHE